MIILKHRIHPAILEIGPDLIIYKRHPNTVDMVRDTELGKLLRRNKLELSEFVRPKKRFRWRNT